MNISKKTFVTLVCVVLLMPSQAAACRVPHTSPDFDALVRLEYVSKSDRHLRFRIPAEMNGSPFFTIHLKYRVLGDESGESNSALEIEVAMEGDRLVGEFSLPDNATLSKSYLEVYYHGSDKPCGTVAIKAIGLVE